MPAFHWYTNFLPPGSACVCPYIELSDGFHVTLASTVLMWYIYMYTLYISGVHFCVHN